MHKQTFAGVTAIVLFAASIVATVHAQEVSMGGSDRARVISTSPTYSKSMDELQRAAQRLREAIQELAQQQPGTQRDTALKAARDALFDAQQAMAQLPPELRIAPSARGGVKLNYAESMRELQHAADRLSSAIHAMAKQPPGERRNQAIREANEALLETQTAIVWLPNASGATVSQSGTTKSRPTALDRAAHGTVAALAGSGTVAGGGITAGSDTSQIAGSANAIAGGVGLNARAKLSSDAAPDHNVKLIFSLNTGNYLAGVHVKVTDKSGNTVIDGMSDGPWLYAKLAPGTYTAAATYAGHKVTERFTVGRSGQRVAHFRWPASVEQQLTATAGVSPILGTGPQESPR